MNRKTLVIAIVLVLLAGAYWLSSQAPAEMGADNTDTGLNSEESQITVTAKGPLGIASGPAGEYLVDKNGLTLYIRGADASQTGTSIKTTCKADCEQTWFPYLMDETDPGITESTDLLLKKLNVFIRADGKYQYALGNQPLYRNVNDAKLGDMNGSVESDWMVAKP